MKKNIKLSHNQTPFVNSSSCIQKEEATLIIGINNAKELFFTKYKNYPQYITCNCKLEAIRELDKAITISANYHKKASNPELTTMSFPFYDKKEFRIDKFASAINIKFIDIVGTANKENIGDDIPINTIIYQKNFAIQETSQTVSVSLDRALDLSNIDHVRSKAYNFAGLYYQGLPLTEIEQYFVFIGTRPKHKEYIDIISAKKIFNNPNFTFANEAQNTKLSTLLDDIYNNEIIIPMPNGKIYKSISVPNKTFLSDICEIEFKLD